MQDLSWSLMAEQSVIGSVLIFPSCLNQLAAVLKTDDFFLPAHREIWEAFIELRRRQAPIDIGLVGDELKSRDVVGKLDGGEGYLLTCANATPSAENVLHYAGLVGKHRAIRDLVFLSAEAVSLVRNNPEAAAEAVQKAQAAMLRVILGRNGANESLAMTGERVLDEIERAAKGEVISRVPTGIKQLDWKLRGGMRPGLVLPMGLTGMGKSSLALQIAVRGAAERQIPCLVFSLEMTRGECWSKMAANLARKPSDLFDPVPHTLDDWKAIQRAAANLNELSDLITIDESRTLDQVAARAIAWRSQIKGRAVIVVDHAQKVQVRNDKKNRTREQEVAFVAATLQNMGQDLGVPVISPAQMNDKASDEGRPPRLGDSRESRALEHESPVVIGIHRNREETDTEATLCLLKNRFGQLGPITVSWRGSFQGFEDSEDSYVAAAETDRRWAD